jgi:hypothetical protein
MKAVYGSLVVLAICFLVFEADACTTINRRNTIWLGNPGPDAAFDTSMIVRVYRTDKYNYNVDQVDAEVDFADASLTKVKSTSKARLTPTVDYSGIYSLVNDTRVTENGEDAFMVLKELGKGVYEIVFRALYSDFPMNVEPGVDNAWWISESLSNFYFANSTGHMVIVANITAEKRDFNSTTSTFSLFDISQHLRNGSQPEGAIGILRPYTIDKAQVVFINYGSSSETDCNDGSAVFLYSDTDLQFIGNQGMNMGYWIDGYRKWWAYANDYQVNVHNYATNQTVFSHTYSQKDLEKIVSRLTLGAWLGPLVAIGALWLTITLFCAVFCRDRC